MNGSPAPSQFQGTIKHDYNVKEFPGLGCRAAEVRSAVSYHSVMEAHISSYGWRSHRCSLKIFSFFIWLDSLFPTNFYCLCVYGHKRSIANFCFTQMATQTRAEHFCQSWWRSYEDSFFSHLKSARVSDFDLGLQLFWIPWTSLIYLIILGI